MVINHHIQIAKMAKEIKEETGDGLAFHNAIKTHRPKITINGLISSSDLSMGTLYRLFAKHTFDEDEKQEAARALGKTVDEIFGAPPEKPAKHIPVDDFSNDINQSDQLMIERILAIIEHSNKNMEKIANANEILAQTVNKLVEKEGGAFSNAKAG